MIELIQVPWSPFCIVQRRILEFSGTRFKTVNISNTERSLVWKLTRERYYAVPIIKDGETVVFEVDDNSQVIAKYLNDKLGLDIFPAKWRGIQTILWRFIENEIESITFKLNDVYFQEMVPQEEWWAFVRHKERKFGHGCLDQWRHDQPRLLEELSARLMPFEQMLAHKTFLLDQHPRFVDFDLFGMLGNFLYSGHYTLPEVHTAVAEWYERMAKIKTSSLPREKLRS